MRRVDFTGVATIHIAGDLDRWAGGDENSGEIANSLIRRASPSDFETAAAWPIRTKTGLPLTTESLLAKQKLLQKLDDARRA